MILTGDTLVIRHYKSKGIYDPMNRIFEVIAILHPENEEDVVILRQTAGRKSRIFTMNMNDCERWGLEFSEGLEVWPLAYDWFNVSEIERQKETFCREIVSDMCESMDCLAEKFVDGLTADIVHRHDVNMKNRALREKLWLEAYEKLKGREEERVDRERRRYDYMIHDIENILAYNLTLGIASFYNERNVGKHIEKIMVKCLEGAGCNPLFRKQGSRDMIDSLFGFDEPPTVDEYLYNRKIRGMIDLYFKYCSEMGIAYDEMFAGLPRDISKISDEMNEHLKIRFEKEEDDILFTSLFGREDTDGYVVLDFYSGSMRAKCAGFLKRLFISSGIKFRFDV